ncbi:hypothetical protein LOTGIDRAFT_236875 [Lottia gigantea]|uniref:Peptidase S1 domain-containing protein n=1 Tax=Lottia gigantea TaxID=225164 RepID=V3ZG35_LOTGI|nr:hypothetical protein LOTGIDRAFT_236875 [Lottia gigantea]ESO83107.1 hypothetical protein LOTGIDRAFT_236875 [Lottia gigantea]
MNGLIVTACLFVTVTVTSAFNPAQGLPCHVVTAARGRCFQGGCPSNYRPSKITNPNICSSERGLYPSVCCEPYPAVNNPTDPWNTSPPNPTTRQDIDNICGRSKSQRILGGTKSAECAWPWQVSIRGNTQGNGYTTYENSLPLCAGVLIDRRWILTSAYCPLLAGYGNGATDVSKNLLVVVGENNIDKKEANNVYGQKKEQIISVTRHFTHPLFKYSNPSGYPQLLNLNSAEVSPYNVALLRLSQDVQFDECRKPACLPPNLNINNRAYYPNTYQQNTNQQYQYQNQYQNQFQNQNQFQRNQQDEKCGRKDCYVAGWGLYDNTTYSSFLLQTQVQLFPTDVCDAIYRASGLNKRPDATSCAEPLNRGKVPCVGDNGGMLVCNENGRWTLKGIISKSFVECDDKKPITVADVTDNQIRRWIDYIRDSNTTF